MNIDKADKTTIKKYITAYLSINAIIGFTIITIMIVFGTMLIKRAMHLQDEIHGRIYRSSNNS